MDELIPRSQAPQPKVFNMQPPSYTVPDVTVIGDSVDSLVLRSCQNWQDSNVKNQPVPFKPRSYISDLSDKENIRINGKKQLKLVNSNNIHPEQNELQKDCQSIANKPSVDHLPNFTSTSKVQVSKENYNPEIYKSPRPATNRTTTSKTFIPRSDVRDRNHPVMHNPLDNQFGSITKTLAGRAKVPVLTNEFPVTTTNSDNSYRYQSPKNDKINQSTSQDLPLTNNLTESPGHNIDPNMLKLFEFQNEQIRYLHKLLEKFMEKSSDDRNKHCSDEHCSCIKNTEEAPRSSPLCNAELSFKNKVTKTRSVATNTEISWGNLCSEYKQKMLKDEICSTSNRDNENRRDIPILSLKTAGKRTNPSNTSVGNELTKALEGMHMDTIYDHVSPEPSLHLEVPEFHDDQSSTDEENDQQYAYNEDNPTRANNFQHRRNQSSVFYEHHKQREFIRQRDGSNPSNIKKGEKLSKAIRNLQKIIHEGDSEDSEVDYVPTKDYEGGREMVGTPHDVLDPATSRIQVEHFGVSVLDRTGQRDARQGPPVFNAFIMSRYLQGEIVPPDNGTGHGRERGRHWSSSRIPDPQLAAIAQKSPGRRIDRRVQIQSDKYSPPQTRARGKEFSIATEQFLCKYQLDG